MLIVHSYHIHLEQRDANYLSTFYKFSLSPTASSWHHGQRFHCLNTILQMDRLPLSPTSPGTQALALVISSPLLSVPFLKLQSSAPQLRVPIKEKYTSIQASMNSMDILYITQHISWALERFRLTSKQGYPTLKCPISLPQESYIIQTQSLFTFYI